MKDATQSAREVYDKWHATHVVDKEASAPWYRMIESRLRPEIDLANRRVLDIGCGLGAFACRLAQHNARPQEVVACDFSPMAVEKSSALAASMNIVNTHFQVADIQNLHQFPDGHFDTIFSCETIEHVPDPPGAVRELSRVLRSGGRLYLSTPNYFSTIGLYRLYCNLRGKIFDEGGQPICHWTMMRKTKRWTKAAGFRVVEQRSVGHYIPIPGRPPIRLNFFEKLGFLTRPFGHHSLTVAEKVV
ncbi:MAG: class I SAM-dependent methyltransferase [Fimbriiglobus sp.]